MSATAAVFAIIIATASKTAMLAQIILARYILAAFTVKVIAIGRPC